MKLTKATIDTLTCPPNRKDALFFDEALPGFGVRVTAAGLKVFLFQYRRGSNVRRLRFGRYGDLTPTEARRLAEVARGEIAAGRDIRLGMWTQPAQPQPRTWRDRPSERRWTLSPSSR